MVCGEAGDGHRGKLRESRETKLTYKELECRRDEEQKGRWGGCLRSFGVCREGEQTEKKKGSVGVCDIYDLACSFPDTPWLVALEDTTGGQTGPHGL